MNNILGPNVPGRDGFVPLRNRLRIIEALLQWAEGSPAQEREARALAKQFLVDLTLEANVFGNVPQAQIGRAHAGLDGTSSIGGVVRALRSTFRACVPRSSAPDKRSPKHFRKTLATYSPARIFGALAFAVLVVLPSAWAFVPGLVYPLTNTRLSDLVRLEDALERFRRDHGQYPVSRNPAGGNDWVGIGWNGIGENWLPELVPDYLEKLPKDPRNTTIQHAQYIYFSDGTDFKLLALGADECELIVLLRPWLNDPRRNSARACTAYGFHTAGAQKW